MNFNYTQQHDRLFMYQLRYLQVPIDLKNDNLIIIKRANPYASTGQGRAGRQRFDYQRSIYVAVGLNEV